MTAEPILEVRGLTVSVSLADGSWANVVEDVSFDIEAGGALGLVGESGSGKTMTSLAIMGLLPPACRIDSGEVHLEGRNLVELDQRQLQKLRGRRMAMVLQDPLAALDPSFTIRSQLSQPLRQHRGLSGKELELALVDALERVHLPASRERLNQFPHQLSGGMRQRVTSAIALAGEPALLIADEPTSALDATTQIYYLELLNELQTKQGFALLLITHDLAVVHDVCQRAIVMYAGMVVEDGPVEEIHARPRHPYTRALIAAIPEMRDTIQLEAIQGQPPDVSDRTSGCRFAPRCRYARNVCLEHLPGLMTTQDGRLSRCWGTAPDGWIDQ